MLASTFMQSLVVLCDILTISAASQKLNQGLQMFLSISHSMEHFCTNSNLVTLHAANLLCPTSCQSHLAAFSVIISLTVQKEGAQILLETV